MKNLIEYLIPHRGLSIGKHEYQFHVDDSFFSAMESEAVKKGKLDVELILDKQSRLITATLEIKGIVKLVCDRCLDDFDFPIELSYEQIYKFGEEPEQSEDEIIYLQESDYQIDIRLLILENIILEIPIKRVHKDDAEGNPTCNTNILEIIDGHSKKKVTDPRWDALKNLNFDD